MTVHTEHSHSYILTAGESNAEGRIPLTLLVERVIEVATEHANALGIGYDALIKKNVGWVLSRLSLEMYSYPKINDCYAFTTWIESYNRHFSERNFAITDCTGKVLGYARTVWVPMDFATRTTADLSALFGKPFPTADLPCPIDKTPRFAKLADEAEVSQYTFGYCDIDFNRHVNTVRYISLLMNHWSLEHYDHKEVRRFDIVFNRECHYGETVQMRVAPAPAPMEGDLCELVKPDGTRAIAARFAFSAIE